MVRALQRLFDSTHDRAAPSAAQQRTAPTAPLPQPTFAVGDPVRVILNDRNRTPHHGTIDKIVWHHKDRRYDYYLVERGKKVKKRYRDEDLEPSIR